jgi:hypothetical protein
LVQAGFARATDEAKYDVAAHLRGTNNSTNTLSGAGSSRSAPGTDVRVSGYYRKDGTYVRPHTRSAPGAKSGGTRRSGGSRRR